MRFSMLYSGEQILSFKSCLVFYAGDSLSLESVKNYLTSALKSYTQIEPQVIVNCIKKHGDNKVKYKQQSHM